LIATVPLILCITTSAARTSATTLRMERSMVPMFLVIFFLRVEDGLMAERIMGKHVMQPYWRNQ
jgi:hypothetical protein